MTERLILGLTGYSGTGKSTISKHLADQGILVEEGSAIIKRAAAERGQVPSSRDEYEEAFRYEQRHKGMSWLSGSILANESARILQSGLRAKPDFLNLKEHGGLIIALVCPVDLCLERIDGTNPKNPRTPAEYREHQVLENKPDTDGYGSHTQWCVDNADLKIDTSQSLEVTLSEIDALFV